MTVENLGIDRMHGTLSLWYLLNSSKISLPPNTQATLALDHQIIQEIVLENQVKGTLSKLCLKMNACMNALINSIQIILL